MTDKLTSEERMVLEGEIRALLSFGSTIEVKRIASYVEGKLKAQLAKVKEVCPDLSEIYHKIHAICGRYADKRGEVFSKNEFFHPDPFIREIIATCQGTGKYSETGRGSDGFEKCPKCEGAGVPKGTTISGLNCTLCKGTGIKPKASLAKEVCPELEANDE